MKLFGTRGTKGEETRDQMKALPALSGLMRDVVVTYTDVSIEILKDKNVETGNNYKKVIM